MKYATIILIRLNSIKDIMATVRYHKNLHILLENSARESAAGVTYMGLHASYKTTRTWENFNN